MMNLILTLLLWTTIHPIHISKCQMEINDETHRAEVTIHVFIDDLEAAIIQELSADPLHLATDKEEHHADSLIHHYLTTHLEVQVNGQSQELTWIGKQQSDDLMAFWCFMESDPMEHIEDISVRFDVLHEFYADQKNILYLELADGESQYHLCSHGQATLNWTP